MDDLTFDVSGDGEPVLFVAGFPFGLYALRRLIALTAGRFRTVAVEVAEPGAAREQAGALARLLSELDIERCAVIAHGTGGRVAQALAFGGDDRVDPMVLLASPGPTGSIDVPGSADDALERAHVEPLGREDAETYVEGWRRDPRAYARGRAALEAGDDVAGLEGAMAGWERPVLILH